MSNPPVTLVPKTIGRQFLSDEQKEVLLKDFKEMLEKNPRCAAFAGLDDENVVVRYSFADFQMPALIATVAHLSKILVEEWVPKS